MNRRPSVARLGFALLTMLFTLGFGSRASADLDLYLNGSYNQTAVDFTYTNGSNQTVSASESGGGNIGATLNGQTVSYLYCTQFNVVVYVPDDYNKTPVNSIGQVHNGNLVDANGNRLSNTASAIVAQNVAWLISNLASSATDANQQAGLQALIWQQLTPGFVLTSTNSELVTAYNNDVAALNGASPTALSNAVSKVLYITPSYTSGVSDDYQALLGYNPGMGGMIQFGGQAPQATPEPATYAMAISALIPLGLVVWRRRRLGAVAVP
jgi:hypothetical protein